MEAPQSLNAVQGLGRLAPWRQAVLLVVVAATIAVGVGLGIWMQSPSYTPLQGEFATRDLSDVSTALGSAGIGYKIADGGMVLVPRSQLQEAEIALASAGIVSGAGR